MANASRRKNGGKRQSRKIKKSRKMSRKGGLWSMPTSTSLKKSMADGAAKANEHYNKGLEQAQKKLKETQAAAQPHLERAKITAASASKTANEQAKSAYNKAKYSSPTNFAAAKTAENTYRRGMRATQPHLDKAKKMGQTHLATLSDNSNNFYNKTFGNKNALIAAQASQRGVPQSNYQYGGPGLIATGNPTMPSQ